MKTEIKKIGSNQRELNIEVSGEIVKNKFSDVFQRVSKEAKVHGFRPGHAPADIIEKQYSSIIHQEVLKELVPDVYNKAIDAEGLDVIELPEITEVKLTKENLSFKAKVEISPEIPIKDYKNLKVNFRLINVASDEIKRAIDSLKEQHKANELDDRFARSLGYPNMQELERIVERQIFINKENQERARIENEIIEGLTNGLDFKVPQGLLKRQVDDMLRQAKMDLALRGISKEVIEAEEKTLLEKITPKAREQVRVYLVLSEVAKKENIPLNDDMPRFVMEFLLREAEWKEAS
ncbi:MAG: trigger factor [Candidatus Omnitrophota bacterium]|nr:trigger factor [Candidatus Omnitrophota bacterium]